MAFDPTQSFEIIEDVAPRFDPSKPFEIEMPTQRRVNKARMEADIATASAEIPPGPTLDEFKQSASRMANDSGVALTKGLIGIPEMAVGLADLLPSGSLTRPFGGAGKLAEQYGFRPKQWKQELNENLSPEQRAIDAQQQAVKGFLPTAQFMMENPSTIRQGIVESGPSMAAGGLISNLGLKAVSKLGPRAAAWAESKYAPAIAGGVGEGTVTALQQVEGTRQQTEDGGLTWGQAGAALASGVVTGSIGAASGSLAKKLGFEDFQSWMARPGAMASKRAMLAKVIGGALTEGVLEEMPQSAQEQVWQNVALNKPMWQGVAETAAQGLITGAVTGAGTQFLGGHSGPPSGTTSSPPPPTTPAFPSAPPVAAASQPAPPALRPAATQLLPNSSQISSPVTAPAFPSLSAKMLATPIQNWQSAPNEPHTLAQYPDAFGVGNSVVKLSSKGGGNDSKGNPVDVPFGTVGTVIAVTGPKVDGNPFPTVTVSFSGGIIDRGSGYKNYGFAEHFAEANQRIILNPPTPRFVPEAIPPVSNRQRQVPLDESERLQARINAARKAGYTALARRLAEELDFLGKPRPEAAMETRTPRPIGIQREPLVTDEIREAAQAAVNYNPVIPPAYGRTLDEISQDLDTVRKPNQSLISARNTYIDPFSSPSEKASAKATLAADKTATDAAIDKLKKEIEAHSDEAIFESLSSYEQDGIRPVFSTNSGKFIVPNGIVGRDERGQRSAALEVLIERKFPERETARRNAERSSETSRSRSQPATPNAPPPIVQPSSLPVQPVPAAKVRSAKPQGSAPDSPANPAGGAAKVQAAQKPGQAQAQPVDQPVAKAFPQIPEPTQFNSVAELLAFRKQRLSEELAIYQQEIGLTLAEAERLQELMAREDSTANFEAKIGPAKAAKLVAFFDGPFNQKANPNSFKFWQRDTRLDPEQLALETDKTELVLSIISAVDRGIEQDISNDRFLSAAIAAMRLRELGGTLTDVAKKLDRHTTKNSSSQGDKAEYFKSLGAKVNAFLASQGIELPQGEFAKPASQVPQPKRTSLTKGNEPVDVAKPKRGEVGGKLSAGEVVLTATGRPTTPFPKVDTSTNRKAQNTMRAVDAWLYANAVAEAEARGDEFNLLQFKAENPAKMPQASKDAMELYLFHTEQPPVIPKALNPLSKRTSLVPKVEPAVVSVQPAVVAAVAPAKPPATPPSQPGVAPVGAERPAQPGGGVGQPTHEPPAVKPKKIRRGTSLLGRFNAETERLGDDILSFIVEYGGMLSKSEAKRRKGAEWWRMNKSDYDDSRTLALPHHNLIYRGNQLPDQIATAAFKADSLREDSVPALWQAISDASRRRRAAIGNESREEKFIQEEAAALERWVKATESGEFRVTTEDLSVGDVLDVEGTKVEVTARDPDTGTLTLQDGRLFETQQLEDGQTIYVESLLQPEPAPSAIVDDWDQPAEPASPKLRPGEKGTGDLLQGQDAPFNLAGESAVDNERIVREREQAAKAAAEAKRIADEQQGGFNLGTSIYDVRNNQVGTQTRPNAQVKVGAEGNARLRIQDPARVAQDLQGSGAVLWGTEPEIEAAYIAANRTVSRGSDSLPASPEYKPQLHTGPPKTGSGIPQGPRVFITQPAEGAVLHGESNSDVLAHRIIFGTVGAATPTQALYLRQVQRIRGLRIVFEPLASGRHAQYQNGTIFINQPVLDRYDLSDPGVAAAWDQIIAHELLHAATDAVVTVKEVSDVWASLSPAEQRATRQAYDQSGRMGGSLTANQLGHEYIRIILEQRLTGQATEEFDRSLSAAMKRVLKKLLNFLKEAFGAKPADSLARQIIERIEGAINGDNPIASNVFTSSPALGTSIGQLEVGVAGQQAVAQGEKLYASYEADARALEQLAFEKREFRQARASLNHLTNIADGRFRQLANPAPDLMPEPTEGVGVINGQVIVDNTFTDKLAALGIQHDPANVKAMQAALFFEEQAGRALSARERLKALTAKLAYYRFIKAPDSDISRLETTIANNEARLATMESVEHEGVTTGQRADEITAAEDNRIDAQAKADALKLDPVNDFFGARLANLRELLDKAKAAADIIKALQAGVTDPVELTRLAAEYEQFDKLPDRAREALKAGVLTDEQLGSVVASLQHTFIEFDLAKERMDDLQATEEKRILKEVEAAEKEFNAAKGEKLEAETVIAAALRSAKGEEGLAGSVIRAAQVDKLLTETSAIERLAMALGQNIEQNRWLYDYLAGWQASPGGRLVFSNANAAALGVSEEVLRDVAKLVGSSPALGSAIVTLADHAAAERAASHPLQLSTALPSISASLAQAQVAKATDVVGARAATKQAHATARAMAASVAPSVRAAGQTMRQQSSILNGLLTQLAAVNYGAALFSQTASSPGFVAMRQQIDALDGMVRRMIEPNADKTIFLGFGKTGQVYHDDLSIGVKDDPSVMDKAQGKIFQWSEAAKRYVRDYQEAQSLHLADPAKNPSPASLGFDRSKYLGLVTALEKDVNGSFLETALADEAGRSKVPAFVRKMLKTSWFRQHDFVAKLVGGIAGTDLRTTQGRWVRGFLNARRIASRFQDIPSLQSDAMASHGIKNTATYRSQVWNEMAGYGREFSTRLKAGLKLPVSGQVVTKQDLAFFKRSMAFEEQLRREVSEPDNTRGVRVNIGGKTYVRPGGYVGDLGMPRHLGRNATAFINDIIAAYADGKGFTSATDLSTSSTDPTVSFWNARAPMLVQHILDAHRDDRSMKLDPLMRKAETALASHWHNGTLDPSSVTSLQDLAQLIAGELAATPGINPMAYAVQHLNSELLQYRNSAKTILDEREVDSKRNSGLTIALSADNEFTKPAASLQLPHSLYDYGALTTGERIAAQSRANHEFLVEYANAMRRAIGELENLLARFDNNTVTAEEAAKHYGGDMEEMRDTLEILRAALKDFEAGYQIGNDPSLSPSRLLSELVKWPVAAVLALPTVSLRNLTAGQMQVYLMERAMGYTGARMAMWHALKNAPVALAKASYASALNIARFVDKELVRHNRKDIEQLVDIVAKVMLSPTMLALKSPTVILSNTKAELDRVHALGYDTKQGWVQAWEQAWKETGQYANRQEEENARRSPNYAKAHRVLLTGAKTVNAVLASIGVENSDQVLNAVNLVQSAMMEQRLGEVAMKFGARLESLGVTTIDPANKDHSLQPSEWAPFGDNQITKQSNKDSLGQIRLFLEGSAGAEGFQLEHNLLKFYQETKAGKPSRVFNDRQAEAVTRSLLAAMNTSLPTNRSSAIPSNRTLRYILTLQGYPADAFLKLINVAIGGTRDRKTASILASKLPLLIAIAFMGAALGGAADGASEWWKRRMQGIQSANAGTLDRDFWTNKDKFAAGAGRFLASNMFYLGDVVLGIQNQVQGNRGFDPAGRVFWISQVQAFANASKGVLATARGAGTAADSAVPLLDFVTRITPGAQEMKNLFGDNADIKRAGGSLGSEVRSQGLPVPAAGAGGSAAGPTTVVRNNLRAAVGEMAVAQSKGDTAGYASALADAQVQMGKLESFYTKKRIELGDSPDKAAAAAKQSVWRDYQELNPVVAAMGGRRPTAAEYQSIISGATGERAETQKRGIQAWQSGAQALFGRPGSITKDDVAANRPSGDTERAPSPYGRTSLTGGSSSGLARSGGAGATGGGSRSSSGGGLRRIVRSRMTAPRLTAKRFKSGLRLPRTRMAMLAKPKRSRLIRA